ncbi:MAG: sulfotransferase [Rhizomicrobium sp.]
MSGNLAITVARLVQQAMAEADAAMAAGRADIALAALRRARDLAPRNLQVLNRLGAGLLGLGRAREAVEVFDAALALAPDSPALLLNKGAALEGAGRLREAAATLERAVAAKPDHAKALARLAGLAVRRGDWTAARDFAGRALALSDLPAARLAWASADLADGNFQAALDGLQPLLSDASVEAVNRSLAHTLTGDALDGLDKPAEAFAAYGAARQILADRYAARFALPGAETARAQADRLTRYFAAAVPAVLPEGGAPEPLHVFLVGFPRSGTTLLEQVLAGHPDIETLEESDALFDVGEDLIANDAGLARLSALSGSELEPLRARYWQRAGARRDRRVFVDKMPLNLTLLPVAARLFPQARVIFALRDPRDVVLSAFRRRIAMSQSMYELTALARAAGYYDAVMRLADAYRHALGLPVLELRHEDLLADFAAQTRRICDFLGVPWNAGLRDFAGHAQRRDIKTPSGPQLARGLSDEGIGQWRRYRAQLEPVLPILRPWIERLGYADA